MRIGLTGGAATVDGVVRQAEEAERDGFHALWYASAVAGGPPGRPAGGGDASHALWYASAVAGDPLAAMAVAGRATTGIELGTAVVQTYPCHPVLQAGR